MEANEAKQMEMLLQEGGIADDGTTVDPVSGNEVPPGSMAEEVRDDVPAQLSEGEYVVPADVTRYYGVKFFEDLRTEAKRGMGQMEADGRIGGEPVSQTMDNQTGGALTPEELAMLQEMGMAVGGMVPPPEAVGNTGEYNKGGQVLYAQDGVDVTAANASTSGVNPYQAQFTQGMGSAFAPGYLSQQILDDYSASQTTQTSIVMLYSPEGIAVSVSLPAEQAKYDQLVAEGYTTTPVATTTETTVTTGNDDPPPPETAKPVNYTGMSEAELQKAYSQNQTAMAMMAGMAAINPIFGAFGAWATNSTKKKIEAEMKRQNFAVPEGGGIFDLSLGGIVDGIKDLLGLSDEETATVAATVGGGDDKTVTPTFTKEDSSKAAPNEASNVLGTSEDDSTTDSLANTVAAANAAAGDSGEVSGQVINAGTANQQVTGATQADIDYLTSAAAGNKGGLMNKKALNKKAKKKALNKQV
jgi:hypothetical protein